MATWNYLTILLGSLTDYFFTNLSEKYMRKAQYCYLKSYAKIIAFGALKPPKNVGYLQEIDKQHPTGLRANP